MRPFRHGRGALSDRLRIRSFVINNDLRHPAVLAYDLATSHFYN